MLSNALEKFFSRNKLSACNLCHGSEKFILVFHREGKRLFWLSGKNRDDSAFDERNAVDYNLSAYNGTSGDLHGKDITPNAVDLASRAA